MIFYKLINKSSQFLIVIIQKIDSTAARREFRRCDLKNHGKVLISDLKTIIRRFGIHFDGEDIYQLATRLDKGVTGYIPYGQIVTLLSHFKNNKGEGYKFNNC